jgi:hypothetical protein
MTAEMPVVGFFLSFLFSCFFLVFFKKISPKFCYSFPPPLSTPLFRFCKGAHPASRKSNNETAPLILSNSSFPCWLNVISEHQPLLKKSQTIFFTLLLSWRCTEKDLLLGLSPSLYSIVRTMGCMSVLRTPYYYYST